MPKTELLKIRPSPEDRQHLCRAAVSGFFSPSMWARQAFLQARQHCEDDRASGSRRRTGLPESSVTQQARRVTEPNPRAPKRTE